MNRQINIASIVPYGIFPAKMGGQKGIALFYEYLKQLVPVTIISTPAGDIPLAFSGHYLPLLNKARARYINPMLFFSISKEIKKQQFTHLVLEHPYFAWLGLLLKRTTGITLVVHSHNIESLRFKSTKKWWWKILSVYERNLHRHADINFFITDEDREYAVRQFRLDPANCHTITYGFAMQQQPIPQDKAAARQTLQQLHGIKDNEKILFFNGTLSYPPNLDAVDRILENINPLLFANTGFSYKIIICGKGLPAAYNELKSYADKNIIYAGFVDDIDVYFKGSDIFINPVMEGGGIKTKLVEALGMNLSAVSTKSGAIGVPKKITGDKMEVVEDGDWNGFAENIIRMDSKKEIIPDFYQHFYWGNIAAKAAAILKNTKKNT